jgi:N-glycosylase/DNA lyase
MSYYKITKDGITARDLNIVHTVESAQPLTFHADYDFERNYIEYASKGRMISGWFGGSRGNCSVVLNSADSAYAAPEFVGRFRLNDDMEKIYAHISTDPVLRSAIIKYHGMRVTLNDPWETTLCFIMSQYNNVKRIRLIIRRFVEEFGTSIRDENNRIIGRSLPSSRDLLKFTEKDFRRCGAGFRARYIAKAAEFCTNNIDLHRLGSKGYETIKEELMEISGVGDKVADCIALMGYGKMEAFPIDVWVKRTLEKIYFKGKAKKPEELHRFAEQRWGSYRGYAQQYLFHYARNNVIA